MDFHWQFCGLNLNFLSPQTNTPKLVGSEGLFVNKRPRRKFLSSYGKKSWKIFVLMLWQWSRLWGQEPWIHAHRQNNRATTTHLSFLLKKADNESNNESISSVSGFSRCLHSEEPSPVLQPPLPSNPEEQSGIFLVWNNRYEPLLRGRWIHLRLRQHYEVRDH